MRALGADDVFDTDWSADLTIMEEGAEFLERLTKYMDREAAVLPYDYKLFARLDQIYRTLLPGTNGASFYMQIALHDARSYGKNILCREEKHRSGKNVRRIGYALYRKKFEITREEMKRKGVADVGCRNHDS